MKSEYVPLEAKVHERKKRPATSSVLGQGTFSDSHDVKVCVQAFILSSASTKALNYNRCCCFSNFYSP